MLLTLRTALHRNLSCPILRTGRNKIGATGWLTQRETASKEGWLLVYVHLAPKRRLSPLHWRPQEPRLEPQKNKEAKNPPTCRLCDRVMISRHHTKPIKTTLQWPTEMLLNCFMAPRLPWALLLEFPSSATLQASLIRQRQSAPGQCCLNLTL